MVLIQIDFLEENNLQSQNQYGEKKKTCALPNFFHFSFLIQNRKKWKKIIKF